MLRRASVMEKQGRLSQQVGVVVCAALPAPRCADTHGSGFSVPFCAACVVLLQEGDTIRMLLVSGKDDLIRSANDRLTELGNQDAAPPGM